MTPAGTCDQRIEKTRTLEYRKGAAPTHVLSMIMGRVGWGSCS